jgi:hypothetical protein
MGNQRGRAVRGVLCAASLALAVGTAGDLDAAAFDAEGRIVLTAEEKAACAKGGGCVVLTMSVALQLLEMAERPSQCGPDWKGRA